MDIKKKVEKYKQQSIHYLENATIALNGGNVEKASEFLWGSMAEALKAVAASEGRALTSHSSIRKYARELAKYLGDASIWDVFGSANYLHSNFYEAGLSADEVYVYLSRIKEIVGKLINLIPEGV